MLVLEAAGAPGHERAGSKGDARIFRLGYPEPHYVEMALLARARWHDLEAATGRRLLHVTGQLTLGDEPALHAIAGALEAAGAPVEQVSAATAARRFPGIAATGTVLVEPDSGVLAADECLRALRETGGFELHTARRVTSLRAIARLRHRRDRRRDAVSRRTSSSPAPARPPSGSSAPDGDWRTCASLPQVAYFAVAKTVTTMRLPSSSNGGTT